MTYTHPSPFPPSFEGNPWAYAFGLFGDVVAATLSLAILLGYLFEARRNREVSKAIRNPLYLPSLEPWSLLYIYRCFIIGVLLFVVMRSLPDALWMLAWGEVSEPCIRFLLWTDLLLDGLALGPLFFAVMCWAWSRHIVAQKLVNHRADQMPPLSFLLVRQNAKIVALVLIIAIGVTIGKASA